MTARAWMYLRCSTDQQADAHNGLDAQADACEACAKRLALPVAGRFSDEGFSGSLPIEKRPGLLACVQAIGKGDVLVVSKRDRLGRDLLHVAIVERLVQKRHGRIVSNAGEGTSDDDPASVLMRQLVDCFASYERALISSRTKSALAARKVRGLCAGAEPFGWSATPGGPKNSKRGGKLVPVPHEQEALALIRSELAAGSSYAAVARLLTERKFRTKCGGWCWHGTSVRSVERTAIAAGLVAPPAPRLTR